MMADFAYRTKKDYALSLIRDLILRGELDAGSHLNQTELAERLNISLTPVREALRQLEAEGLVAATAHRGVRVRSADPDAVRNVYIARRLLEPYVAARATSQLSSADCKNAAELLRRIERAPRDPGIVRKANYDFHFLLFERCDAPLAVEMIRKLWLQYPWDVLTVVPDRMVSSKQEHREILAAMEARDGDRVAAACTRHLVQSYFDIARYLEGSLPASDPFDVGTAPPAVGS